MKAGNKQLFYAANIQLVLVIILLICQVLGLTLISEITFSEGLIKTLCISALSTMIISVFISKILEKIPPGKLPKLKMLAFYSGVLITAFGLVGLVFVHSNDALIATDKVSMQSGLLFWGNLLLALALTLGVPVLNGVIYEDAMDKRNKAISALRLVDNDPERDRTTESGQ